MEASKIKYYDASPNPDHFTKEQIERVVANLKTAPHRTFCALHGYDCRCLAASGCGVPKPCTTVHAKEAR